MITFYFIYLLLCSLVTFLLYGIDKSRAKRGACRIPEKMLLGASFLGGAVGGLLGMQLFRHKTKHWYFYAVNILAIVLHVIIALMLLP